MKNILLLILIPLSAAVSSAQTCVRDTAIHDPGYYPEQLPGGAAGSSYSESIQFNVPADTEVVFSGNTVTAIIDSIKVLNVLNLPPGLTYACNPASCGLPGGQTSCGNIYGTIDQSAAGNYPFTIPIRIYARINGSFPYQQNDTIFKLGMEVLQVGVKPIQGKEALKVYPNPANGQVNVAFTTNTTSMDVELRDMQGRLLTVSMEKELNVLRIDSEQLVSGIYYGTATNGTEVFYFKFVKN